MWLPLLFGFALFLSSALLFVVQPMIGRTLLPHLGGNPIAWNACLVFFQATLLAGYLYANVLHRFRGLRWQPWLHMALMAMAMILCFVGVFGDRLLLDLAPRLTGLESWPVLSTLSLLIVVIGLPYLALAAVSPLVQRWFAHLDHPKASDPYFLFVASNLGGLTALVVYPLMIEPFAPLYAQWLSWKLAVTSVGMLLLLVALCAWLSPRSPELEPAPHANDPDAPLVPKLIGRGPATVGRRMYWLFASALPVGLMMGVTDYLTLDVAPVPILWTVPLALYLIAFSQSFARFSPLEYGGFGVKLALQIVFGVIAAGVTLLVWLVLLNVGQPVLKDEMPIVLLSCLFFVTLMLVPSSWLWLVQPLSALTVVFLQAHLFKHSGMSPTLVLLYLTCYYLSVRLCLEMLAKDRPATPALTTYYTWIGIGGLCGGLFQLVVAPLVFPRDYLEYSFLAALACTLRGAWFPHGLSDWLLCLLLFPKKKDQPAPTSAAPGWIALGFDVGIALAFALLVAVLLLVRIEVIVAVPFRPPGRGPLMQDFVTLMSDFPLVIAVLAALLLLARPVRFGLALAAIVALSWIGQDSRRDSATVLVQRRTSFGILRVSERTEEIRLQRRDDWLGQPIPQQYTERRLMHSTTMHGACITDPPEMQRYPTSYYHRKGPVGQVMRGLEWFPEPSAELRQGKADFWLQRNRDNAKDDARIAASVVGMMAASHVATPIPLEPIVTAWSEPPYAFVGLGTGTLFTYAHPFQWVDAYELDPAIIRLSTESNPVFHYYQSAQNRGVNAQIIPGDARRSLSKPGREGFYQVIFVDAFNSDAIPVHLLTQEAIEIYFQKLAPDGILCFHTSNRYIDLPVALDNLVRKHNLSSTTLRHRSGDPLDDPSGSVSEWYVIARNQFVLRQWVTDDPIFVHDPNPGQDRPAFKSVWTDDHASLLAVARPGQTWSKLVYGLLVLILFFGILLGLTELTFAMLPRSLARPTGGASPEK